MAKSTYGTGCFLLLNTGDTPVLSQNRLLTTPAYRIDGRTTYAMEGSIFVAGAAIKWLRDGLGLIKDAAETAALAMRVPDNHGVYMVPAFVGLGAPHWVPTARGLICGLTFDATGAHLVRAALESVAFQTLDLASAMAGDGAQSAAAIRVDGGMAANDWFCQFSGGHGRCPGRSARPSWRRRRSAPLFWRDSPPGSGRPEGRGRDLATGAEFRPAMAAARRDGTGQPDGRTALRRTLLQLSGPRTQYRNCAGLLHCPPGDGSC